MTNSGTRRASGILSAGITPWVVRCRGQPRHQRYTELHGVHTELHGVDYLGASRQGRFRAKRHHSSSVKLRVNSVQLRVRLISIQRLRPGGSTAEFPHGLAEGRHPRLCCDRMRGGILPASPPGPGRRRPRIHDNAIDPAPVGRRRLQVRLRRLLPNRSSFDFVRTLIGQPLSTLV